MNIIHLQYMDSVQENNIQPTDPPVADTETPSIVPDDVDNTTAIGLDVDIVKAIRKSAQHINNVYDKLNYFDVYGANVAACILMILVVAIYYIYTYVQMQILPIRKNWSKERCKPYVLPFASYIMKPKGDANMYNINNMSYCMNGILEKITSYFVKPLQYILWPVLKLWAVILSILQIIRKMFHVIRQKLQAITENITNRIYNILIPFQKIGIALLDMFGKIQGILVTTMYIFLGVYLSIRATFVIIMTKVVVLLIALAVMIIAFWAIPFTWGMAIAMTAIFLAISIPLLIIMAFMLSINVKPLLQPPGVPSRPACFVGSTMIYTQNRGNVPIRDIQVDDVLKDGGVVTSTMQLIPTTSMYKLNDVIVTGTHYVLHDNTWIYVKDHPEAEYLPRYYCDLCILFQCDFKDNHN